jgi:hypothetical protein
VLRRRPLTWAERNPQFHDSQLVFGHGRHRFTEPPLTEDVTALGPLRARARTGDAFDLAVHGLGPTGVWMTMVNGLQEG